MSAIIAMMAAALVLAVGARLAAQTLTLGPGTVFEQSTAWARRAIGAVRPLVVLVGWLTILVALDFGVGSAWSAWRDGDERISQQAATTVEGQIPRDPRADTPAFDGYPWVEDYLDELSIQRYEYEPFTTATLSRTAGRYVNTANGVRRSYQPPGADDADALEVWFFGGSTMFGEGQRDEHTIPSEIARLAEEEGLTIRPVNFGHQGQLLWQEMLRFEAEVADRGAPDLAVFYDGTNDFNYQVTDHSGQPTHGDVESMAVRLGENATPLPPSLAPAAPSVWRRYEDTSFVGKVLDRLDTLAVARPAGASPRGEAVDDDSNDKAALDRLPLDAASAALVDNVLSVYSRSVEMAQLVADTAGVPASFFWQPIREGNAPYAAASASLPDGVIDLSDALLDPPRPVFIDGGHTNEVGAQLVADAIYASIDARLQSLRSGP